MQIFLKALGNEVWQSFITDYIPPKRPPNFAIKKELQMNNKLTMNVPNT